MGPLSVVLLVVVVWVAVTDCRKNAILLNLGRVFYNKMMTVVIKKLSKLVMNVRRVYGQSVGNRSSSTSSKKNMSSYHFPIMSDILSNTVCLFLLIISSTHNHLTDGCRV